MTDARDRFSEPGSDYRKRLKQLQVRSAGLQKEEAAWALADALDALFKAADALIPLATTSAEAAEALDQIFNAIAELLDGLE